jgi:hypothetical protein
MASGSKAPPSKSQLAGQHLSLICCLDRNFLNLTGSIKHSANWPHALLFKQHFNFWPVMQAMLQAVRPYEVHEMCWGTVGAGTCTHGSSAPSTCTTALLQRQGFSVLVTRTCRNLSLTVNTLLQGLVAKETSLISSNKPYLHTAPAAAAAAVFFHQTAVKSYSVCTPRGRPLTRLNRGGRGSILRMPDRSGWGSTPSKLLRTFRGRGRPPPGSLGRLNRPCVSWGPWLPCIKLVMLCMMACRAFSGTWMWSSCSLGVWGTGSDCQPELERLAGPPGAPRLPPGKQQGIEAAGWAGTRMSVLGSGYCGVEGL